MLQQKRNKRVEPLAYTLEHNESERDSCQSVKHTEHLATVRLRAAVSVT